MLRFTVVSVVVALTLSAIGLAALAPVNIWVAALTAAPVMVMVMALALLPIFAMALESAYIGSQRYEAAEVEELDSRAPISHRDRFTPGA